MIDENVWVPSIRRTLALDVSARHQEAGGDALQTRRGARNARHTTNDDAQNVPREATATEGKDALHSVYAIGEGTL